MIVQKTQFVRYQYYGSHHLSLATGSIPVPVLWVKKPPDTATGRRDVRGVVLIIYQEDPP